MKLFIDGQFFQTGALDRGMGVYALELLNAVKKAYKDVDIEIILNRSINVSDDHQKRLETALVGYKTIELSFDIPSRGNQSQARAYVEEYIAGQKIGQENLYYLNIAVFLFDYFVIMNLSI